MHVLVAGSNAADAAKAAAQIAGVTKVIHADAAGFEHGLAENVAAQVIALAPAYSHIVFPATASGKNVAPRVAALLDVGQVSDITKVVSPDTFERPIYAGNAIATVQSQRQGQGDHRAFDRLRCRGRHRWHRRRRNRRPPRPTTAAASSSAARSPRTTAPN